MWRQRKLPPPVLWCVGGDASKQANAVDEMRSALTAVGFDGALSPVFFSDAVHEDAMLQLSKLLDRHLPDPVVRRDLRSPSRRRLDTLCELVSEKRVVATVPLLEQLRNYERARLEERDVAALRVCLSNDDAREGALFVLGASSNPLAQRALRSWLLPILRAGEDRLSSVAALVVSARTLLDAPEFTQELLAWLLPRVADQRAFTFDVERLVASIAGFRSAALASAALDALVRADDPYHASHYHTYLEASAGPELLTQAEKLLAALERGSDARKRVWSLVKLLRATQVQ